MTATTHTRRLLARRRGTIALALLGAVGMLAACVPGPARPVAVDRLVSTGDGMVRLEQDRFVGQPARSATDLAVDVDVRRTHQRFDGVGASLTDSSAWLLSLMPADARQAALRDLFDPGDGAGLTIVRLVIGSSDFAREMYSYDDSDTPDPELTKFSIDHDRAYILPVLKEILAINPRIAVMASPWSAPAWMKTSNFPTFGSLLPEYEDAYARYLVRFLDAYRDEGVDIPLITLINEPLFEPYTYPGMRMEAEQQTRILRDHLAPALRSARLRTKVLVYDHNWDRPDYPLQVLNDPGAAAISAGVAFHCYGGSLSAQDHVHAALPPSMGIWQTECSGGEWQGTRQQAFEGHASLVVDGSEHWSNATLLWNLALDPDDGPHFYGCGTCRGIVTIDGDTWRAELDRDVLAHLGRWVPVGSVRVASTDSGADIASTAYRTRTNRVVLVLHNKGAARSATVNQGRARFTVELPARSLTTLRWISRAPG